MDGAIGGGRTRVTPGLSSPSVPVAADATVAVWPVINIEVFPDGGPAIQPHLAWSPEVANSGWREYGLVPGLERLVRLFERLHLPANAAISSALCECGETVATVRDAGWYPMGHGRDNSTWNRSRDAGEERREIAGATAALEHAFLQRPWGWLTPGFRVTATTADSLAAAGYRYTADLAPGDEPKTLDFGGAGLVGMPYSLETNDISLCISHHASPAAFGDALVDHVTQVASEPPRRGLRVVALGLHTFIAGQPARALHLQRALERIQSLRGVTVATGEQIMTSITDDPMVPSGRGDAEED